MGNEQTKVIADATCTACGCLCDDIALTVAGQAIVEARNEEEFYRDVLWALLNSSEFVFNH